jgi:hypothetical protein
MGASRMRELSLRIRLMVAALIMVVAAALTMGCHSDAGQPLSDTQKTSADRLATISKSSGGDWDKVSQEDKDYLIKNLANGDEHTAKMLIAPPPGAHGGPPGAPPGAGGPPAGGPGVPPGGPVGAAPGR